MAKKSRKTKTVSSAPSKRSRVKRGFAKARSASRKSGLRWGEIALSALVGYEGDKILRPVGPAIAKGMSMNEYTAEMQNAFSDAYGSEGGQNGPNNANLGGYEGNKLLGLAAILKAGYDVVKHKKLSESDKNILIPYGIGTVFDGPVKANTHSGSSGGWQ